MVCKFGRLIGLCVVGLTVASSAHAEVVNVTTGAQSLKLGGEFRSELKYSDNGLSKSTNEDVSASTNIEVQTVHINLNGNIDKATEYAFRFNLIKPDGAAGALAYDPLDYGYVTHWFNDAMGLSIGRMKLQIGGWDNWNESFRTHAHGAWSNVLPLAEYTNMAAVNVKAAGQITLQLFNDVVVGNDDMAQWNKTAHPSFTLGWMGAFGPVEPIIQYGSYDNNKSNWIDVGVQTKMAGLVATLDYHMNTYSMKGVDGKKSKSVEGTITAISLRAGYEIKGAATPWIYFSTMDNAQPKSADALGPAFAKDLKTNDSKSTQLSDNGVVWGLGADLHMMGEGWTPYVALVNTTGKWEDPKDSAKQKDRSEMTVKIGAYGSI